MLSMAAFNQLLEDHNVANLVYNDRKVAKIFSAYAQLVLKGRCMVV